MNLAHTLMQKFHTIFILITILSSCARKFSLDHAEKTWKAEEYTIARFRLTGPVGPPFHEYYVFRKNRRLNGSAYLLKDSCTFRFRRKPQFYQDFNICDHTITELRPDKRELSLDDIKRITFRPNDYYYLEYDDAYNADTVWNDLDTTITKQLNPGQIETFVDYWNKSRPSLYYERRSHSEYLFMVHLMSGETIRIQTAAKIMCLEHGGWNYMHEDIGRWDKSHEHVHQTTFNQWWKNN